MELTINIDETRFGAVLDKELEAFSKEEIHEILKDGMKKYLETDEQLKQLFVTENNSSWYNKVEATPLVQELAKSISNNILNDEQIEEMRQRILDYLKSEEVVSNLLKKVFLDRLMSGLTGSLTNNSSFDMLIYQKLSSMINLNQNNQ